MEVSKEVKSGQDKIDESGNKTIPSPQVFIHAIAIVEPVPLKDCQNKDGEYDYKRMKPRCFEVLFSEEIGIGCGCPLRGYSCRENAQSGSAVFYAYCKAKKHKQKFKFSLEFIDSYVGELTITSNKNKIVTMHDVVLKIVKCKPLSGEERKDWAKNLAEGKTVKVMFSVHAVKVLKPCTLTSSRTLVQNWLLMVICNNCEVIT